MSWQICPASPYPKYSRRNSAYVDEPQEPDLEWPGFRDNMIIPGTDETPCSEPWKDPDTGVIKQWYFDAVVYIQWTECDGYVQGDPNQSDVYPRNFGGVLPFSQGNKEGYFLLGGLETDLMAGANDNGYIGGGRGTGEIQVEIENPLAPSPTWLHWINGENLYNAYWESELEYSLSLSLWGHSEFRGCNITPALIALGGMLSYSLAAAQVFSPQRRRKI